MMIYTVYEMARDLAEWMNYVYPMCHATPREILMRATNEEIRFYWERICKFYT